MLQFVSQIKTAPRFISFRLKGCTVPRSNLYVTPVQAETVVARGIPFVVHTNKSG